MSKVHLLAFPLLLTVACSDTGSREGAPVDATGLTGTGGEEPEGSTGGEATTGSDTGDDTPPPMFDVGDYDPDGDHQKGCEKVDLLFLVDDSGSMGDNQVELVGSFPEFIQGIKTELGDVESYHLGVVTTDAYSFNEPGCIDAGLLVTRTGGEQSSNTVCGPFANGRYMTADDDLEQTFACAAQVGTSGSGNEKPIDSIRGILDPTHAQPGMCNEGFLRDDSLLVIVVLTDEDDLGGVPAPFQPPQGSVGTPPDWYEEIVAARGGLEENIVFLALLGDHTVPNACEEGQALQATQLIELASLFPNGFVGDICADSYAPFFKEAVSVVDGACDSFVPPG